MQLNRTGLSVSTLLESLRPHRFHEHAGAVDDKDDSARITFDAVPAADCQESSSPQDPAENMLALNVWQDAGGHVLSSDDPLPLPSLAGGDNGHQAAILADYILRGRS
jgi:hypothetical protein